MTSLTPAVQGGTCGLQCISEWPVQSYPLKCVEFLLTTGLKHIPVLEVFNPVLEAVSTVGRWPK